MGKGSNPFSGAAKRAKGTFIAGKGKPPVAGAKGKGIPPQFAAAAAKKG